MNRAKIFAFPARSKLAAFEHRADQDHDAELAAALGDAIARGYAEGLARGREEAKAEAQALLESSYREGTERGHAAGLAEMSISAEALRNALAAFDRERASVVTEAEAFCVELALAIVARVIDTDKARVEFARRATQAALKALAPEAPTAIFLNSADFKSARKAMADLPLQEDATLAPGTSRVEAGRLLVESSIEEAFAQVRSAVVEIKLKRTGPKPAKVAAEKRDAV